MSLLKVKAKITLVSEEDMELEELDMGIVAKSKAWVWRPTALLVGEIYKIFAFSSSKSIIQMYDGEKILVAEQFGTLCDRWQLALQELYIDNDEDGNNEESDVISDEDED